MTLKTVSAVAWVAFPVLMILLCIHENRQIMKLIAEIEREIDDDLHYRA